VEGRTGSNCGVVCADGGSVEEPLLSTDITFVIESHGDHDPASGHLALWSDSLTIERGSRQVTVDLGAITDLAPGYVPRAYSDVFEDSIGLSYARGTERGVILVEPTTMSTRRLLISLLSTVIDQVAATIAHPVERGEQETDAEPERRLLSVHPYELEFGGTEERGTGTTVKFSSLIHLDDTQLYLDGERVPGLSVRYLQTIGPPLTTELRVSSDRQHTLLRRVLNWEYNRRVREIKRLSLDSDEEDVLVAIHSRRDGRDRGLIAALDKTPAELAAILDSLTSMGLVRESGTKLTLTQTGHMLFTHEMI
jgi:helix-turn-helix protein